ncbi:hypothetical protein INR49_003254 [Caranx melampygus]|nr:hypothetical protein INR49_003254 [Caranx melampygus]
MGMASRKKRLYIGGTVGGLVTLCVYLQGPLSWSSVPAGHFQKTNSSLDSEPRPDRKSHSDPWSPWSPAPSFPPEPLDPTFHPEPSSEPEHTRVQAPTHAPTSNHRTSTQRDSQVGGKVQNVSKSSTTNSPSGAGRTRTSARTPAPQRPPQTRQAAPGPTEPPFIGDTYMSEDVPPQTVSPLPPLLLVLIHLSRRFTDCPDGIRSHVAQTEFGGRFLQRIPVLQWAEHVTQEQHQRLSRYPGAHGWGGIDYKTLVETLSVLDQPANRQLLDDWTVRRNQSKCIYCAVVGNGGILNNSKKGKEIDSHHYVFRTNGAIIKGFEEDVGSRTTHYTFSTNTLMNSMRSYRGVGYEGPPVSKETRYVFLPDHDRDYLLMKAAATHTLVERGPEKTKDPLKYFGEDVSVEKLKMYHPDFIRYLRNRFLRSRALQTKYKDIYRPSTGAVMLLAALHTCDKVSAYGFMTSDYQNYSDHYYDRSYHSVGFFINRPEDGDESVAAAAPGRTHTALHAP